MMCSTWKISVFGIVALMLAFGLTAGDAFAHSDGEHAGHTRTTVKHFSAASITSRRHRQQAMKAPAAPSTDLMIDLFDDDTETLRATEKLDSLVFTYSHGGVPSKTGTVTLTIPRTWTRAQRDNGNGTDEAGEIEVSGGDTHSVTSGGGGWQVKVNYTDDPPADGYVPTVITYKKVTVPNRAGKYEFGLSSTTVGDGHVSTVDPHSTNHAKGNDPDIDDPIDTDPRAHSHSDDTRNLGSITITVESDKDNHDNHEHTDGETGSLKIIDGHRHGVDKTHSHNDDGHVDTSELEDGHQTHPLGKSSHKHNTSGTAIAEHSHAGMTVDKQNHEHAADAGGEARTADVHTHDGYNRRC